MALGMEPIPSWRQAPFSISGTTSGIERKAIKEGFAYYIPLRYSRGRSGTAAQNFHGGVLPFHHHGHVVNVNPVLRSAQADGHELPGYYRNCIKTLDVAMFQVAPMDEHGFFNFGPGGSHLKAVCDCAKTIIVEVKVSF